MLDQRARGAESSVHGIHSTPTRKLHDAGPLLAAIGICGLCVMSWAQRAARLLRCQPVAVNHCRQASRIVRYASRCGPRSPACRCSGDSPAADSRLGAICTPGGVARPAADSRKRMEPPAPLQQATVLSEAIQFQRYLTVYQRRVRFTPSNGSDVHTIDFDIAGHPQADFSFAVTFPFHPADADAGRGASVTVVREYAQGLDAFMYCLPTGGRDPARHADLLATAKAELSEEAWLAGGTWVRLLPEGHPGLAEVKWCRNRFQPFLVIDPQPDAAPGSRDAEEVSLEVLRMPLGDFQKLVVSGDMLLPSVTTSFLALKRLQELGLID